MSLKTGSRESNWAWDKPVKAFIWRSSRICRPIGGLPPWFFEDSLPHLLLRNNSNQLAKPHFATFMGTMASRLIGELTLKVLGFAKGRAFAEFRHIVIQDGSSFAIHDALREVFPGRFKVVKPAAVELHTTMDLLCDAPTTVVLTPDTTSEQAFLPEPTSLRASVLLSHRGYVDLHYLRPVQDEGGFFLIRAKAGMNPQVVEAFREDGTRLRSLRNKPLKAIHAKLPKRQRVELVVEW